MVGLALGENAWVLGERGTALSDGRVSTIPTMKLSAIGYGSWCVSVTTLWDLLAVKLQT